MHVHLHIHYSVALIYYYVDFIHYSVALMYYSVDLVHYPVASLADCRSTRGQAAETH